MLVHRIFHTSTLEAKKTQVGAMSTGSMLFREYLQTEGDEDIKPGRKTYQPLLKIIKVKFANYFAALMAKAESAVV